MQFIWHDQREKAAEMKNCSSKHSSRVDVELRDSCTAQLKLLIMHAQSDLTNFFPLHGGNLFVLQDCNENGFGLNLICKFLGQTLLARSFARFCPMIALGKQRKRKWNRNAHGCGSSTTIHCLQHKGKLLDYLLKRWKCTNQIWKLRSAWRSFRFVYFFIKRYAENLFVTNDSCFQFVHNNNLCMGLRSCICIQQTIKSTPHECFKFHSSSASVLWRKALSRRW